MRISTLVFGVVLFCACTSSTDDAINNIDGSMMDGAVVEGSSVKHPRIERTNDAGGDDTTDSATPADLQDATITQLHYFADHTADGDHAPTRGDRLGLHNGPCRVHHG